MFKQVQSVAKIALAAASLAALSANAAVVYSDNFDSLSTGQIGTTNPSGNFATGTVGTVGNWSTTSGYAFVTTGNGNTYTGLSTSVYGAFGIGSVSGSTGNYVAIDAAFQNGTNGANGYLTSAISGLVAGNWYELTFSQATAQALGFTGNFTADWQVSIDGQTVTSTTMGNQAGFSTYTWVFKYTGGSNVLSFLAQATGGLAEPPFVLLDNVTITDTTAPVPEPAMLGLVGLGLAGVALSRRKQKRG